MFYIYVGSENIPHHRCGAREGPLTPCRAGPRDFEEVRHYHSRSALTPPLRNPKSGKMWGMVHLSLMQHCENSNTPPMLKGVQLSEGRVRLLLVMESLRLFFGIVYEMLSPTLHLVQQREVALGITHLGEGATLHDGPHLRLFMRTSASSRCLTQCRSVILREALRATLSRWRSKLSLESTSTPRMLMESWMARMSSPNLSCPARFDVSSGAARAQWLADLAKEEMKLPVKSFSKR